MVVEGVEKEQIKDLLPVSSGNKGRFGVIRPIQANRASTRRRA